MEFKILYDLNRDIINIRTEAFIIGRGVSPEIELDGRDSQLEHFCLYEGNKLLAYLRAEEAGKLVHIGRVAVCKEMRNHGLGRKLLEYLFETVESRGFEGVELSAVDTAVGFYEKLGFVGEGDYYMETGVPHIYMKYMFNKKDK